MAKQRKPLAEPESVSDIYDYAPREHGHVHSHELQEHVHPHEEHIHGLPDHEHPHEHELPKHEHKHEHRDLRGHLRGAIRSLLVIIEAGNVNSEQVKAIHAVRVIVGDAHGSACAHANAVYEADDILVCQDCREVL